ncbi:phosphoenolpyruvate--protein phosphotransferase [uncultured Schumannella sp.]|uniref:phosphoenolpyruvate--protein phosphotransferase n=1 Tax=uncultured Schumannella sp. TaxID=1195956 RepID=UPI0025DFE363|nr:phosphoenolpyruvate--protein phosphotransferase [uncultured Schumannella sp.]
MPELHGIGIGRRVAVGPVLRMAAPLDAPNTEPLSGDAADAIAAVDAAVAQVADDLEFRGSVAGGDARDVLEAQALMAKDPALRDLVVARIESGTNAERAVYEAFDEFKQMLIGLGGYLGERAADLGDVAQRIIARLRGVAAPGVPESETPYILVAEDLAPADTVLLDLDIVLGLITREGGPTSHTAILARARSIPAIVGVSGAEALADGDQVVLDAAAGTVTVEPDPETLDTAAIRIRELAAIATAPITPGALADGTPVPLLANLGSSKDAAAAVELGAEGVGLFRTEFLFLDSTERPSVETQTEQYREMLQHFRGKKVVVRCLDAGADKPLPYLTADNEENPALGLRGIRALREHEEILRDQLVALVAAEAAVAAEGEAADLWVMAPMVADAEETEYFVTLARELGLKTVGVMAEVPSLALQADAVLAECDFVSIGTNDLTQYTMAADRMLGSVAHYQDPWHPAVLRLVKMLADAGIAAGRPVGVCGEAAADPQLAVVLVGLGVTSLSMTPAALAEVRAELASRTPEDARRLAEAALAAPSAATARAAATIVPTA